MAASSDPRVLVVAPEHDQAQNLSAFIDAVQSSWGCEFACNVGGGGTGGNATALVDFATWLAASAWGASVSNVLDASRFFFSEKAASKPRFLQIAGDVGLCSMHDGHHFPLGAESAFIDALAEAALPFRYHRCARCPQCAVCPGSTWKAVGAPQLAYIVGRRLVDGADFEASLPKVTSARADVFYADARRAGAASHATFPRDSQRRFRVFASATAGGAPAKSSALLWYNFSPNRTYNSPSQPLWRSVALRGALTNLTSPWIDLPSGAYEAAWYVEVATPPSEVPHVPMGHAVNFTDASPIRFAFRTPSKASMCNASTMLV